MKLLARFFVTLVFALVSPAMAAGIPQYNVPIGLGVNNSGLGAIAPGAAGQIVTSNGASANPSFSSNISLPSGGTITAPSLGTNNCIGSSSGLLITGTCTNAVNVRSYATCNGTGNDTTNFTAAMAAASAAGKSLYIPGGAVCMTENAVPPANLVIYGDGPTSVIQRVANAPAFNGSMNITNCGNTFYNLTFDGNSANETNTSFTVFQTGCNATYLNIQSNNAYGSSGDAIRLNATSDGANHTYTRLINVSSSNNGNFAIYLQTVQNVIIQNITIYNSAGITTEGSGTVANDNQNVVINGGIIDCDNATQGGALKFGGYSLTSTPLPTTSNIYFNVSNLVIKNCGSTNSYGMGLDATSSSFNNITMSSSGAGAGPVLFNAINSTISNSTIDCNKPTNGATICIDAGGSVNSTISNNYIGPTVLGDSGTSGTGINLGASINATVSGNKIVVGDGSSGQGIAAPLYDGGGGYAFTISGANAQVYNNLIECSNSNCLGVNFNGGFDGVTFSGNQVLGTTPENSYIMLARNVQLLGNSVSAGNQSCQTTAATVMIVPDWCSSMEVSGSTEITAMLTTQQNIYNARVPWAVITNPGSGYTSLPTVTFSGGGCAVEPAGTVALTAIGGISDFYLSSNGTGCSSAPTISFSGGGGSGATATAQLNVPNELNGRVVTLRIGNAVTIANDGTGFGAITTRNGSNISASAGQVFQFYNGPADGGYWTQIQ